MGEEQDFLSQLTEFLDGLARENPDAEVLARLAGPRDDKIPTDVDVPVVDVLRDEGEQQVRLIVADLVEPPPGVKTSEARPPLRLSRLVGNLNALLSSSTGYSPTLSQVFEPTPTFRISRLDLPIFSVVAKTASGVDRLVLEIGTSPEK